MANTLTSEEVVFVVVLRKKPGQKSQAGKVYVNESQSLSQSYDQISHCLIVSIETNYNAGSSRI